ncbi:MAG: acyl-CoA thioesterase [Chlorobium sp.]|uniref:acyl-CoA thioesterase n=1 Tax=Chlorobium sp. TaxID=1095 RepID=UPI0025BBEFEC|nr:acyl-CoA thioesterase [Chlorobium sp.]MCF8217062.1 acyl-CoA thioesterase [Chlorobium sp.]MCF8271887.1 acyl-CoA thioesterase [Chlorobium sp.]MCF8288279.1 acyl-CoA thioesterase [Chlorobium sp.]MCF8291849.1 acyl-CoA thioesterase [Chlorobium sp.]MCF8385963.1 acyl-CoA thioesterase [Chlorobium sp.]
MNGTERFEIFFEAQPEDIDMPDHVNNVVYLRWIQDAAIAHWNAFAPPEDRDRLLRVVRSHAIEYKRPAFAGDALKAETWIGSAARFAFDRHTEIVNRSNGRVLAAVRTVWCPLDRVSGRPADVSDTLRNLFCVSAGDPAH